jgi:signal transduction histidine kinase
MTGRRAWLRRSWARPAAWALLLVVGVGWLTLIAGREVDRARRTAELLEHDYSAFVADRLVDASAERYRRLVGLSGLDTRRERPSALSLLLDHTRDRRLDPLPEPPMPEIRYLFAYDVSQRRLRISGSVPDRERSDLQDRLARLPHDCGRSQILPFGRLGTLIAADNHEPTDWSGFAETDAQGAVRRVYGLRLDERRAIDSFLVPLISPERECECLIKSLLPDALGRSAQPLRSVSFVLRDATADVVFRSNPHYDNASNVRRGLSDQIPFAGWTVEVAVNPQAVRPLLPYGGNEPSWLLLAVLVAVVVGSGALAVQSLRRGADLVRLRQSFVANVSHELKAPLSRIRLLNELLLRGRHKDPEKASRYARVIDRECRRLGFLVDNVLDFARIESSSARPERTVVDLRSVAEETIESFRAAAEDRLSLTAHLERVPPILGDAGALSQVLANLLDNAVKYSPPGSPIEVSLCARDGWVEMAVADQGRGIPEGERERIFDAFYRVEAGDAPRVAGSGLGLALVRLAVEAHGGCTTVESAVGGGSRFLVRLPAKESEPPS